MSGPMPSTSFASSTLEQCYTKPKLSDHCMQHFLTSDLHAAGSNRSMNPCYRQESPNQFMSWQNNWFPNPHCYNLLSDNSTTIQDTTPRSVEAASSSFGSSSEQIYEGSPLFPHIDQNGFKASFSLLRDWDAYQLATSCSSYSQLLASPLNYVHFDSLSHEARRVNEPSVLQPHEADAIRALSQRLDGNLVGTASHLAETCLASNQGQCPQSAIQHKERLPSIWNATNSVVGGGLVAERSNLNSSANRDCVAHFSLEPRFAERAARFSSLMSENYEPVKSVELSGTSLHLEKISPGRVTVATSSSSGVVEDPTLRRSVSLLAGCEDISESISNYTRKQMPECCTPVGVYPKQKDMFSRGFPNYCQQTEKQQQAETPDKRLREASVDLCTEDLSKADNVISMKRRRLENNEDKHAVNNTDAGSEISALKGEQAGDGNGGKRQKCKNRSKGKDEGKGKSTALGETSPNVGETDKCNTSTELPKQDYIHVRARRGQATDSHSLAERVRREKISERMRFLQDLVPGCSKITGKAMMLDEIINYVQSLQHQVEFLSMKLAALSPRLDFNFDSFFMGEVLPPTSSPTEVGAISEMGNSSATLYQMLQTSIPLRDTTKNFSAPVGNELASESPFDRTVRCKWDV